MQMQQTYVAENHTALQVLGDTDFGQSRRPVPIDLPDRLGPYVLEELIGRGAMGEVWAAIDNRSGSRVALKFALDSTQTTRLRHEAEALAQLDHAGIVSAIEWAQIGGWEFLVLEFVAGQTLQQVIEQTPSMPLMTVLDWMHQLVQALQHCHEQAFLHGDIKPANIIVREDGHLMLIDFGLARNILDSDAPTDSKTLAGSPAYMAPELFLSQDDAASPQSDLFSLGIVLYELLTGHPPFQGSVSSVVNQILTQDVCQPSKMRCEIPHILDELTLRLLARSRENRFQTIDQVIQHIKQIYPKDGHPQ